MCLTAATLIMDLANARPRNVTIAATRQSVIGRNNFSAIPGEFLAIWMPTIARSTTPELPRGLRPPEIRSVWTDRYRFKFGPDTLINSVSIDAPGLPYRTAFSLSKQRELKDLSLPESQQIGRRKRSEAVDKTLDSTKLAPSPKSRRHGPPIQPALQCARFVAAR